MLYNTKNLPRYYSLSDLNGKSYITSIKSQSVGTMMCWSFAEVAAAETYLIKNEPEYVKNKLGYKIYDKPVRDDWHKVLPDELDLSEVHNAMSMFMQIPSNINSAVKSQCLPSKKYTSLSWPHVGANESMMVNNLSTWRGLVIEDENLNWEAHKNDFMKVYLTGNEFKKKYLENYRDKTIVNAESIILHSYDEYMNKEKFVNKCKEDIIENDGVIITARFSGVSKSINYNKKNSTNYGDCAVYTMTDETTEGGYSVHVLYSFGYDDDVEIDYGGKISHGAFICKDSMGNFALMPYDFNWISKIGAEKKVSSSYMAIKWVLAGQKYKNNYYYDSGNSDETFNTNDRTISDNEYSDERYVYAKPNYMAISNIFKMVDDEKLKAVSYFSPASSVKFNLMIYKVDDASSESLKNLKETDLLYQKVYDTYIGVNCLNVDKDLNVNRGDNIAIILEVVGYSHFPTCIDSEYFDSGKYTFKSTYMGSSYIGNIADDSVYCVIDKKSDKIVNEANYNDADKKAVDDMKAKMQNEYNWVEIGSYLGDDKRGNLRIKLLT